ncbi:MAG: hypothetical protein QOK61_02460 [Nitrososphaeraceae archaeon]|jgi:alpha-L-arabinofuranosidase|nr:hypothetical protein [Nitrososphaeraceae archaeon]
MVKHNIIKMSIMILTIAILGTTAVIINPANMAYAQGTIGDIISNMTQGNMTQGNMTQGNMTQGNMTQGNMTTVIDVDTLTKNIKERHPILTQMSADEDQDLMVKIKGMDPKEAAKTTIALNMLRLLQQYKQLDVE